MAQDPFEPVPNPTSPVPPVPVLPPIDEPEPDRLPDEDPIPNPDENDEPPIYARRRMGKRQSDDRLPRSRN
ncbi:hypothetical protein EPK99_12330 [Neorhizobium lilium]|uniref:Uncharacterized protein n=1 Tax=Neorhizobium lilium TaxID=2503024 RepID=A0A444LK22_9HYPH|nr:hypothetical protein EPK99_12330 [Neorhizobium lilium]